MPSKTLGRGLSAFLDSDLSDMMGETETEKTQNEQQQINKTTLSDTETKKENIENDKNVVHHINVADIVANPFQPRHDFDEEALRSLADSIKRKGVLQPILVIKQQESNGNNNKAKYQLIAGERRFRATKMAGLTEIPAIVTEIGKKDQLEIAILENIQREDLNPIDEAEAYKRLMDEFSHTQEELSEILGKSRSHIANILRLLTLPNDVKDMIRQKQITFGHARALIGTENTSDLAHKIVEKSMSVRETENFVKAVKDGFNQDIATNGFSANGVGINESNGESDGIKRQHYVDPEVLNIAQQISSMIGMRVNIKLKNKGGTVEINFKDFTELDRLLSRLNG